MDTGSYTNDPDKIALLMEDGRFVDAKNISTSTNIDGVPNGTFIVDMIVNANS